MRRFILLSAILMLFYLKGAIIDWKIKVNKQNVISEIFISETSTFPPIILTTIFYIIILICIISLFFRSNYMLDIATYIISITILTMGYHVAFNMLAYKEITNFLLFDIYHPIPLEAKKQYLLQQLSLLFTHNGPNITPELLELFQRNIKAHFENMNWEIIAPMNPIQIKDYALTLLTTTPHELLTGKEQRADFLYDVILTKDSATLLSVFLLLNYAPTSYTLTIVVIAGIIDSIITYLK